MAAPWERFSELKGGDTLMTNLQLHPQLWKHKTGETVGNCLCLGIFPTPQWVAGKLSAKHRSTQWIIFNQLIFAGRRRGQAWQLTAIMFRTDTSKLTMFIYLFLPTPPPPCHTVHPKVLWIQAENKADAEGKNTKSHLQCSQENARKGRLFFLS